MRQFPEEIRPLAMAMAGATVPQIVDECAPLGEYPPNPYHVQREEAERAIAELYWKRFRSRL